MLDYSFIGFSANETDVLQRVGNPSISQIKRISPIQVLPNEVIGQFTNLDNGISFNGNLLAELIDCNGNILEDITTNFYYYEFLSNGISQIYWEFYTGNDYGFDPVRIKLTNTVGIEVYYSNPFFITAEDEHLTARFEYKSFGNFYGNSYNILNYFQSIRLICYLDSIENQTESKEYFQLSTGNTVSSRALYKQLQNIKFDYIDFFTYERVNIMLIHDAVYIDEVRLTNKPQLKGAERDGFSNHFTSNFQGFLNMSERRKGKPNLVTKLQIINFVPQGLYRLVDFVGNITMTLNRDFQIGSGVVKIYNSNDELVLTLTHADFAKNSMGGVYMYSASIASITQLDDYTIDIEAGFLKDDVFELEHYVYTFSIKQGSYSAAHYNTSSYFTN